MLLKYQSTLHHLSDGPFLNLCFYLVHGAVMVFLIGYKGAFGSSKLQVGYKGFKDKATLLLD